MASAQDPITGLNLDSIDGHWLIAAIARLETKMDAVIHLEGRVTALERYKSWLSGAVAMAGAVGAFIGWYLANHIPS